MKEEESYEEYCSQLRMISDQLAEMRERNALRTTWKQEKAASLPKESPSDTMDWEPSTSTAAHHTKKKEPRWGSPEEVDRRRQEGLCLRCGKEGYYI